MIKKNWSFLKEHYWILIIFFIIFIIWLLSPMILRLWYFPYLQDRAMFGDSFGWISSLFSGFAFAGLIYTIWLQKKELVLQREDIQLQRKELQNNTKELKNQSEALDGQLKTAKITAQLNTLPGLIEEHAKYLEKTTGGINELCFGALIRIDNKINFLEKDILFINHIIKNSLYPNSHKNLDTGRSMGFENKEKAQHKLDYLNIQISKYKLLKKYRILLPELFEKLNTD